VLGVLFTPDLALEKQVTSVSDKCFFQLRQLRRVRRSLDRDSAATLVHAFVTSRIHCESKKTRHYSLIRNFAKCLPIFNVLSLLNSAVNLQ